MNLRKTIASLLAGVFLLGTAAPALAAGKYSGTINASGSTAIMPLAKFAASEFMQDNPDLTINISGGGSFTGLKQVAEGSVNIGNSDVPAEGPEYSGLVAHKVGVAPFVIITYKNNKVTNLTQQQLIDIFTGKLTNWNQVGGENKAITIIGRSSTSGSRATIKRTVLKGQEFTDKALVQDSNGAVRKAVGTTDGAIGYVDAAYIDDTVKVMRFNDVTYNEANVVNGKYPIWTYEYMYTKGQPSGAVKAFIEYVQSSEFQNYHLTKLHFIPLTKMSGKVAPTETKKPTPAPVKTPQVYLNGKKLAFDVNPVVDNGRTMVPLRKIFESMGAKVTYVEKTQTITAVKGKTTVKLVVGQKKAYKNTTAVNLDVPAKVIKGRTLVPVRFAAEAFGGKVVWNNTTQVATITLK